MAVAATTSLGSMVYVNYLNPNDVNYLNPNRMTCLKCHVNCPPPPPCPFSPEGGCSYLAAGSMDGSLSILDARTGMLLAAARYAHSRGTPTQLVVVGPACLPACLPARPPARPPASPPHRLTATHQAPMIPYCPPPPPGHTPSTYCGQPGRAAPHLDLDLDLDLDPRVPSCWPPVLMTRL